MRKFELYPYILHLPECILREFKEERKAGEREGNWRIRKKWRGGERERKGRRR